MARSLHIREVPDRVHKRLVRRAAARGLSLRRYTIDVLEEHCAQPTVDEWLDGLHRRRRVPQVRGAEAVRSARAEDDAEIARARHRR